MEAVIVMHEGDGICMGVNGGSGCLYWLVDDVVVVVGGAVC